jgi:hypothetical protein
MTAISSWPGGGSWAWSACAAQCKIDEEPSDCRGDTDAFVKPAGFSLLALLDFAKWIFKSGSALTRQSLGKVAFALTCRGACPSVDCGNATPMVHSGLWGAYIAA